MKRSISLFFVGLLTAGLMSFLSVGNSFAQQVADADTPAAIGAAVSIEMTDEWSELYPDAVSQQSFDAKAAMDAGAARAAFATKSVSEASGVDSGATANNATATHAMEASIIPGLKTAGSTVITYRWDEIPWKQMALRWVIVLGFTWLIGSTTGNSRWNGGYWLGAVLGSVGFFLISPLSINHIPQWPIATLGSSLPELGSIWANTSMLNPITASALIPFLMLSFLISHPRFNWMTVGVAVGFTALLSLSFFVQPAVLWIDSGFWARVFLAINALICLLIAHLSLKTITDPI